MWISTQSWVKNVIGNQYITYIKKTRNYKRNIIKKHETSLHFARGQKKKGTEKKESKERNSSSSIWVSK